MPCSNNRQFCKRTDWRRWSQVTWSVLLQFNLEKLSSNWISVKVYFMATYYTPCSIEILSILAKYWCYFGFFFTLFHVLLNQSLYSTLIYFQHLTAFLKILWSFCMALHLFKCLSIHLLQPWIWYCILNLGFLIIWELATFLILVIYKSGFPTIKVYIWNMTYDIIRYQNIYIYTHILHNIIWKFCSY